MRKRSVLFVLSVAIFFVGTSVMAQEIIALPQVQTDGAVSLESCIAQRRSVRQFKDTQLSLEQISQLFWAAQGVTVQEGGYAFRSVPSAGALYPLEIYAITSAGVFHYLVHTHQLEQIIAGDHRVGVVQAALGQRAPAQAALTIVICAVYERVTAKYGKRGLRYADMEAGHCAQNIHLQAVSLGLGSVPVGAFNDRKIMELLGLPEDQIPLYLIPIGDPS